MRRLAFARAGKRRDRSVVGRTARIAVPFATKSEKVDDAKRDGVRGIKNLLLRGEILHPYIIIERVLCFKPQNSQLYGVRFSRIVMGEVGRFKLLAPSDAHAMFLLWSSPSTPNLLAWESLIVELIEAARALMRAAPGLFPYRKDSYDQAVWIQRFVGVQMGDGRFVDLTVPWNRPT